MIQFGTGGWRALIGEDFTKQNVQWLTQAVASIIQTRGQAAQGVVVGFDRRFLSDKAARWVAETLAGNGVRVFFMERIAPTPLVMYTVKQLGAPFGAAVTASHNPADYNGIKLFTAGGRDATEEITALVEEEIARISPQDIRSIPFDAGLRNGLIQPVDLFNEYIDTILGMIDTQAIRERKLKVILDPMYGVSKTSLQTILITTRCELEIIHDRHDTLFGGRLPSPNAITLQHMQNMVVERGYDIGIGTDGDADRLGISDERGNFIHPNDILAILYYYLMKYKGWRGDVVRNVATTHLLDRIAEGFGQHCHEVPVGFKHISAKMEETDALIGGESSGGLTIRGHIKGKDGVFAASLLIELLCVTGKHLSDLLDEIHRQYGNYAMVEGNYAFSQDVKESLHDRLFIRREYPRFGQKIAQMRFEDGMKVYFANGGWIICRFSGTEPLLRIFCEMEDKAHAEKTLRTMTSFLGL
ncbi:MAG: phosphoglucomutase/phosphomannomutase family protein [Oscillospiraceae bacterium]|jgi:phosphomannomutase|nr:phosphoglucomutase/phosphomannomutase family protein [Oscillospiraceae bacterium]